MPWRIEKQGDKHCVVKKDTGKVVKCHSSPEKAKAHMRALYASEKKGDHSMTLEQMAVQLARMKEALKIDEPVQEPEPVLVPSVWSNTTSSDQIPANWSGYNITIHTPQVTLGAPPLLEDKTPEFADSTDAAKFSPIRLYFREGEKTPDGRCIDPNAVNFDRPPPYSIRLQTTQPESGGHAGAVVCGVITKIARDGLTIICDGFLDLSLPAGQEAFNLINNRTMQTWSPDLGDAVIDTEHNAEDEDSNEDSGLEEVAHFIRATFLGATLVAMPALASAVVELLDEAGNITVPAPSRGDPRIDPAGEITPESGLLKYITERQDNQPAEIAACAGPAAPPRSFFTDPEMDTLQRFTTITPDGRIYGHSAGFGECHIGFRNRCVTIDLIADCNGDGNFEYATPGYTVCDDDSKVPTGPITIKGGHAARGLAWQEALSHYDDPSAAVADVVYGTDQFGVWFSGAVRPTATVEQIRTLLASGVSLDAREIDGKLRYLATCAVNTPGYPKAQARLVASSEEDSDPRVVALIAPDAPEPVVTDDCSCEDCD